jgi:hypothetical protein
MSYTPQKLHALNAIRVRERELRLIANACAFLFGFRSMFIARKNLFAVQKNEAEQCCCH